MPIDNFDEIHRLHQAWKKDLLLSEKEIRSLTEELTELGSKPMQQDQLIKVEHFQNALIRQKEVVNDQLQLIVKADKLMSESEGSPAALTTLHARLQEDMDTFDRLFIELREEFRSFKQQIPA